MKEVWIEARPGIEVSNLGRARNASTKALYNPSPDCRGHLRIKAKWLNKNFSIHRLVAESFCENTSGKNRVRHIDGDFLNNAAGNLQWYGRKTEKREATLEITKEVVRELLTYLPETGEFFWKERDRRWFKSQNDHASWNAKNAGNKTGSTLIDKNSGYSRVRICIFHQWVLAHRVAWMIMSDDPVPMLIDHKNQDATDNRWKNLRKSDHASNSRNKSLSPKNTSGITGVYQVESSGNWVARGRANGKNKHLGTFKNKGDAAKAAREFRKKHGYDENHGLRPAHYAG